MTTLLAAALAVANVTRAAAADIVALTGHVTQLGAHCSALVYYILAPDGFNVVVTTQQGSTNQAATEYPGGGRQARTVARAAGHRVRVPGERGTVRLPGQYGGI